MSTTLALVLVAATASGAPPTLPTPLTNQKVALVISGGVSEGSYQAGATYSLMRYLALRRAEPMVARRLSSAAHLYERTCGLGRDGVPEFDVAAGSSAGNVNAFLAAITWCDEDPRHLRARENLFWDTWVNIGWDTLSPVDPDEDVYRKLFDHPYSLPPYSEVRPPGPWRPGTSVYEAGDGLVTRRGFGAGEEHLRRRLEAPAYRACDVSVGLTATRTVPGRLRLGEQSIHSQRYVVPLRIERVPGGELGPLRVVNVPSLKSIETAGLSMALPYDVHAGDGRIGMPDVLNLIKASAAFPIAFAPVELEHCVLGAEETVSPGVTARSCPPGFKPRSARFIDGGILDNQPFGLAAILAGKPPEEQPRGPVTLAAEPPEPKNDRTFFFIDVNPPRHPIVIPEARQDSNGLTLLGQVLADRVDQLRGYENLGLARYNKVPVRTNSRFFPLVADMLPAAFGAFMHPSFRVYDYFVGVYDGIFWIAQSLEHADDCKQGTSDADVGRAPTAATFWNVAKELVGDDPDLLVFVKTLFDYERYWTGEAGAAQARDFCRLPPVTQREPAPWHEDQRVFQIFESICENDQQRRRLQRSGTPAQLRAYPTGFNALMDSLPEGEFLGDLRDWKHATVDRLLRRAIDIERADQAAGATNRTVEQLALVGRFGAAAFMERAPEIFDLDPSTVERISGRRWTAGRAIAHLLPSVLVGEPFNSRFLLGWEPKLRLGRLILPVVGGYGEWYPYLGTPMELRPHQFGVMALGGIGWDPPGRTIDDVLLGVTAGWRLPDPERPQRYGLELATYIAGTKFRLAVGLPSYLGGMHEASDLVASDRFKGAYFSLGLGDSNGSLYWLARSLAGYFDRSMCEEHCDGPPVAKVSP